MLRSFLYYTNINVLGLVHISYSLDLFLIARMHESASILFIAMMQESRSSIVGMQSSWRLSKSLLSCTGAVSALLKS